MKDMRVTMDIMIHELIKLNQLEILIPEDGQDKEQLLKNLMTISMPHDLSEAYYKAEESYIKYRLNQSTIVEVEDIGEHLIGEIYLYRGDITKIRADAIVNAANEKLLGCFVLGHLCIDNAIHYGAGLGLRKECLGLMKQQEGDEPVGRAKVTRGYNLPSKYVVPIEVASEVALKTIDTYLCNENHHLEKVIIDVFSEADYNDYRKYFTAYIK